MSWELGWARGIAFAIALLLLATAAAKAHSPREAVAWEAAYKIPLRLSAVVVQVELIFACLLLFAVSLRRTLAALTLLFCGFAVFSAYRAWAGDESCGCFAVVNVHPLHTLMLDVVVAVMAGTASRCASVSEQAANVVRAVSVYALLGLAAGAWIAGRSPIKATDGLGVLPTAGLVLLEPESWHGKPIPVGDHLNPRHELASGSWIVLFFHHHCPDCQAALPRYEELAQRLERQEGSPRVLLVEVPPSGTDARLAEHASLARLSDDVEWFIQAPVEVRIEGGLVTSASLELPALNE